MQSIRRGRAARICAAACFFASCGILSHPENATATLKDALAAARWSEPRFTGANRHGECERSCPDGRLLCINACPVPESLRQRINNFAAGESLVSGDDDSPSPEGRPKAVLAILLDEPGPGSRQAMEILERASETARDAASFNDLAAAHLLTARRTDRPAALAKALEAAERALQLDPRLPEALFNHALALESLRLDHAAAAAWDRYASVDPDSDWTREAQARRKSLDSTPPEELWRRAKRELDSAANPAPDRLLALVDGQRTAARQWLERELLPIWGRALLEGDRGLAEVALAKADSIATILSSLQRDPLPADSIRAIRAAVHGGRGRLESLARGHRAFGVATAALLDFRIDAARDSYRLARDAFSKGGSPFRWKAQIGLAVCLYHSGDPKKALELLAEVKKAAARSAPLAGRTAWLQALCHDQLAQPFLALRDYRESLRLYAEAGETENQANVEGRLAEILRQVGEIDEAWKHRYRALEKKSKLREAHRIHFLLGELAEAAAAMNLPRAALTIQDQALRASLGSGDAVNPAIGRLNHAAANLRAGRVEAAKSDLDIALEASKDLPDEAIRRAIESAFREVEGLLWLDSDPSRAALALSKSIRLREQANDRAFLPKLYGLRSAAHRAAGSDREAESDLRSAVRATEAEWEEALRNRDQVEEPGAWPVYFDRDQGAFGQLIGQLASSDPEEALGIAEQARARELLDLLGGKSLAPDRQDVIKGRVGPRSARQIQLELPEDTVLIEYRAIQGSLLLWAVSREKIELFRPAASVRRIESRVQALYRNLNEGFSPSEVTRLLEELHRELIPRPAPPAGVRLVFVPDGPIHGVPFAALRDPATGRHLVQDHVIAVAPSASLYLVARRRNRELAKNRAESVLLVSDPAFDASIFPDLPRLPGALRETKAVGRHYSRSLSLAGEDATRQAVLRELGRFAVVHFAGHAIPNFRESYKSILALAPSPPDGGALRAFELMKRDFEQTRLVVLSACSTAGGHPIGSLGVSSLVRPFLGGGVPAVVASLWAVRDSSPERLFSTFHERFLAGADASTALRDAQLRIIAEDGDAVASLESWAAFQVIGEATPSKESTPWDSH